MSFRDLIGNNWAVMVGVETVTFTPKVADTESFSVAGARFRQTGESEALSGGISISQGMAFVFLPVVNMNSYAPMPGDKVQAADTSDWAGTWSIQDVSPITFRGRWKLVVVKDR